MSTNELTLTLVGWVATDPKHFTGPGTTPFTSFRMASTRRYFDRAQNLWVDGRTEWFTIKSWRSQALNLAESLRKSDPVVVHGRLATEEWTGPEGPRTSLVVEALAIGPDLTFGQAKFRRTVHLAATPETDGSGVGPDGGQQDQPGDAVAGGKSGDGDGPGYPSAEDPWVSDGALTDDDLEVDAAGVGARSAARAIT